MNQQIQRINHMTGTSLRLFGRAVVSDGSWATLSNVNGIRATVKKTGTPATYADDVSRSCIYDVFQTSDPAWTDDSNDARTQRGYNFSWTVPASAFPTSGWYTIEVVLTDSSGGVTKMLYEGAVRGSLGTTPAVYSSLPSGSSSSSA